MHRDSLGHSLEISPGAVNLMTAGRGVVHSERTPEYLRQSDKRLHGLQIWIALPQALEEMPPSFVQTGAEDIPRWTEDNLEFKLIAGEVLGRKSPVPVHSPLYFIEIKSLEAQTLRLGEDLFGETALYILQGSIQSEGNTYQAKQILVATDPSLCHIEMSANSIIYIFGGQVFPEERFINWNFVSSNKARLQEAKEDWINGRFPQVPGETDFVPYPPLG